MKNFPFGNLFLRIEEQKTKSQKNRPRKIFLPHTTLKWKSFQPQKKYVHIASLCDVAVAKCSRLQWPARVDWELATFHVIQISTRHVSVSFPQFGDQLSDVVNKMS